jgi:hypothetical protein
MTPKDWTIILFALTVSLALLVGCQAAEEPLETLTREPTSGRNCTINQFEAREEGFRAMGGTGGMALNYDGSLATPVGLPSIVSGQLNAVDDFAITKDVAILILDDFGQVKVNGVVVKPSNYLLDKALFNYTHEGDTPEAIAKNLATFLEQQIAADRAPHGAMVLNHTLAILEKMTGMSVLGASRDGSEVTFKLNNKRIRVKAVETNNFDTLAIRTNLEATINALKSQGFHNFAINMSFSIVPCEMLFGYQTSDYDSLEDYLTALGGEGYGELEEALLDMINLVNNDPLKDFIDSPPSIFVFGTDIIFVASAGNYSGDFPLAPAVWENVISVASSNVTSRIRQSSFSNDGEMIAPGAWFTLTDPLNRNGVGKNAVELVYAGTSFSDTALTIFSALDLGRAVTKCAPAELYPPPPPKLAYGSFENKPLTPATLTELCP